MRRGPKPVPTTLKLARGSRRIGDLNRGGIEPRPKPARPTCPTHLSRRAKVEWKRVSVQLERMGLLTQLDRSMLALYCQAYGRWVEAEEEAAVHGLVVKTKSGMLIQNPYLGIANRAAKQLHEFLVEFGMSPSSRTRVSATPPTDADNAKSRFFKPDPFRPRPAG